MRIKEITTTTVCVPFEAPLWSIWGAREGITRTLLRMETDNGLVGWGEAHGRLVRNVLEEVKPLLVGQDPRDYGAMGPKLRNYGANVAAICEMAMLDLCGRAEGKPVHALLGRATRTAIPFSGYVFYRTPAAGGTGGEMTPEQIAAFSKKIVQRFGFKVLKLKGSVQSPEVELETLQAIRDAVGDGVRLRWDANGGWSVQTAVQLIKRVEALGLNTDYVEDPVRGLAGLADVAAQVHTPVATDTWITSRELLGAAVRLRAVDVVMGDMERWGGIVPMLQLAAVCETAGLGLSMHSWGQLGIATAAQLHYAAVTPHLTYAVDGHYHHQLDDVLVGGPLPYTDGTLPVPSGPGLGVEVDESKVERYHQEYLRRQNEMSQVVGTFERDVDDPCRKSWRASPAAR